MRELFLQIVYGRTQTAFSEGGLPIGAGLEDLGKGLRSQVGTMYGTVAKGVRYLEMAEGYVTRMALDDERRGHRLRVRPPRQDDGDRSRRAWSADEALKKATSQLRPLRRGRPDHQPPARDEGGPTMALFESYERRIAQINTVLAQYGIASLEEAQKLCEAKGVDVYGIVKGIQPICFENVCWAYILGAAIALKKGETKAVDIARTLGEGLQAFCIPGSVADDRKVGIGHGNLASMLLQEETKCFAFLAGHESFAAAEGAIGLARSRQQGPQEPLRVILNGLGKDAAQIISRINGFTYVQTKFDYATGKLAIVREIAYSKGEKAKVRCYGADDVREGRGHQAPRGRGCLHHRQLHQPDPLPAPGGRHLQEGMPGAGQEVLLRGLRRRHRPHPASRQHGRRSRLLRHDRHHGPHALRRPVRRFLLRARARRDDGLPRHGQQPHGRRLRRGRRGFGCRLRMNNTKSTVEEKLTPHWMNPAHHHLIGPNSYYEKSLGEIFFKNLHTNSNSDHFGFYRFLFSSRHTRRRSGERNTPR